MHATRPSGLHASHRGPEASCRIKEATEPRASRRVSSAIQPRAGRVRLTVLGQRREETTLSSNTYTLCTNALHVEQAPNSGVHQKHIRTIVDMHTAVLPLRLFQVSGKLAHIHTTSPLLQRYAVELLSAWILATPHKDCLFRLELESAPHKSQTALISLKHLLLRH